MPEDLETKEELKEPTEEEKQKEWDDLPVSDGDESGATEEKTEPEVTAEDEPVEEPPAEIPVVEEPQYREVVHNGQVHRITEEKYLELAQKGFDYDTKVGPHARIVKLIEQYPEVADMVDSHVKGKLGTKPEAEKQGFEVKPLSSYETADEWLKDNVATFSANMQQANVPQAPTQEDINAQIVTTLKMHDPQDFATVFPEMKKAVNDLTIAQYQRVDSDLAELLKFYDSVKAQVKAPKTTPPRKPLFTPPFKVTSGKLPQQQNVNTADKIWDLPNSKFNAAIDKAKGFA